MGALQYYIVYAKRHDMLLAIATDMHALKMPTKLVDECQYKGGQLATLNPRALTCESFERSYTPYSTIYPSLPINITISTSNHSTSHSSRN
jgi:hypothetical protein